MADPLAFDELYGRVGKSGATSLADVDRLIEDAGWTVPEYKAQVATRKAAAQGSGGPLGGGAIEAGARGLVDAATFGFGDELGATIEAASAHLTKGTDFGKTYEQALERRRSGNEAFAKAYPKTTLGGEVAGGLATAPFMPGFGAAETLGGAAARGVAQGAVGGAAYGAGSGTDAGSRALGAAQGGTAGAALGGALGGGAHLLGFGGGAARPAGPPVIDRTGNLTPEAADLLRQAGHVEPNEISRPVASAAALGLQGASVTPESLTAAVRNAIAERHKVPLAAPQAAGVNEGVAALQRAQAGVLGERAQRVAEQAGVAQHRAMGQAAENVAQAAAPGAIGGYGEAGTGELVGQAVNKAADDAWTRVGQAYASTGADKHVIPAAHTGDLLPTIMDTLDKSKLRAVGPQNAPTFGTMLDTLRSYVVGQDTTLSHLDEVRKAIGRMARDPAISDTDRSVSRLALGGFDKWLDDAVGAQASTLPAQSVAALKGARAQAKDWFRTFEADPLAGGADKVGPTIEAVRAAAENPQWGGLTGQALFDKLMGRATGFDAGALPVARKVRDIVGAGTPEWQTLQQGMVRRVLFGDADKQAMTFQPGEQAWRTMATRIRKALDGRGADHAAEMLGAGTVEQLRQLGLLAESLSVTSKAGNPSGSGYEVGRQGRAVAEQMTKQALSTLGGAIGLSGGGPVGSLLGSVVGHGVGTALRRGGDARNARQIAALVEPYAPLAARGAAVPFPTYAPVAGIEAWLRRRQEGR